MSTGSGRQCPPCGGGKSPSGSPQPQQGNGKSGVSTCSERQCPGNSPGASGNDEKDSGKVCWSSCRKE